MEQTELGVALVYKSSHFFFKMCSVEMGHVRPDRLRIKTLSMALE